MKSIISIIIFLLLSSLINAQELLIKVNTGDCINCILVGKDFKKIDKNINTKFVFKAQDFRIADKILYQLFGLKKVSAKNKIISDSLFNELNALQKAGSSCHLFYKNQEEFSFQLLNLPENIDNINNYKLLNNATIIAKIPDSIGFTISSDLLNINDNYIIIDYKFGEIMRINEDSFSLYNSRSLFNLNHIHQLFFDNDRTLFNKYAEVLKTYQKWNVKINKAAIINGNLYLLCDYYYPLIEGENLVITSKVFLAVFNHQMENIKNYAVNDFFSEEYEIDIDFFKNEGNWYFSVFKENLKGENYFLTKFDLIENEFHFNSFVDISLPKPFKKNKLIYDYSGTITDKGIFLFNYFNYYFDANDLSSEYRQLSEVKTPNEFKKERKINFQFFDLAIETEKTSLLLSKENKVYLYTYENGLDSSVKNKYDLNFNEYDITIKPILTDKGILYFDKQNQLKLIEIK